MNQMEAAVRGPDDNEMPSAVKWGVGIAVGLLVTGALYLIAVRGTALWFDVSQLVMCI